MSRPLKILMLEDSPVDAEIIQRLLLKEKMNCEFSLAMNKKNFVQALAEFSPDIVLSDNSLPQFNAIEALKLTRSQFLHIPFILVTGTVSDEYAADAIKQGADDYILKDRMTRLPVAIDTALRQRIAAKEKLEAAEKLRQNEENYRTIMERLSDAFVALDKDWHYTYVNKKAGEILKREPNELIGKHISTAFPEDVNRPFYNAFHRAMGQQINIHSEEYYAPLDIWLENYIYPSPDGLSIFFRDITERKQTEEELRKSNERFQYAMEASSDIIWELNFESNQYLVHEGKEKLFGAGTKLNWKLGMDGRYIVEEDRENVQQSFMEARMDTTRKFWEAEYRIYSENNSILYIVNHAIFIRDPEGKAVRAIGAITNITEKKNLEAELFEQQKREQLKITATALEAQEKERSAIGQELHDNVNQILVGTKLFLSMVKEAPAKNANLVSVCMDTIQNAIDENRKIAHALVAPDFETKNLEDQITDLAETMFKTSGIDVTIDTIHLDEDILEEQQKLAIYRIVQEQCTNIVKYAKARLVNISLNTSGNFFKMIISDDGIGMEENKKTTGIGLKNIKGRLTIFNGTTSIKTKPGKGFTLEITIPLKRENKIQLL